MFLTGTLSTPLTTYGPERVDLLQEAEARQNLEPMLMQGENLDVNDLKDRARLALKPLFELSVEQLAFVKHLHEGVLRPDLIFDKETAERLMLHPHLRWKVVNVRKHLGLPID